MDSHHKILFYGNSLVLAGVRATFEGYPGFETIGLDRPTTPAEFLVLKPTVVIFDMGAVESEFLLAPMQELPGLLLVGVDPESHEVLLTGQAACSISLEQLRQIVGDLVGHSVTPPTPGT